MRNRLRRSPFQILLILIGIVFIVRFLISFTEAPSNQLAHRTDTATSSAPSTPTEQVQNTQHIPEYVLRTLAYVQAHQEAPPGYVGGRVFQNREKRLPEKTAHGNIIHYQEWDVHPQKPGVNRGPERLVTGQDGRAWYTADHYRSFSLIGAP
ncbi:MAG: ribonuclease N [Chitinophagaceae bacterium]|nr:ribonuclease N [Chitinophagaceae bacterium]